MPDHLRITELRAITWNYGVFLVFDEGETVVVRVCDILCLSLGCVDRVYRDDSIVLVWEESGRIVPVDNRRAGKDSFCGFAWEYCNGLVSPVVEVPTCGMTPVLIARYVSCWVVFIVLVIEIEGSKKQDKDAHW